MNEHAGSEANPAWMVCRRLWPAPLPTSWLTPRPRVVPAPPFASQRVLDAARVYYSILYGYHGDGYVSGFKDIRCAARTQARNDAKAGRDLLARPPLWARRPLSCLPQCERRPDLGPPAPLPHPRSFTYGRAFGRDKSSYADFEAFLAFLRSLCADVRLVFNRRRASDYAANEKVRRPRMQPTAAGFTRCWIAVGLSPQARLGRAMQRACASRLLPLASCPTS
jgi:hypothetical protein